MEHNVKLESYMLNKVSGLTLAFSDGFVGTIPLSDARIGEAKSYLASPEAYSDELYDMVNPAAKVSRYLATSKSGRILIKDGNVVDTTGMEIPDFLVKHLVWMVEVNAPVDALLNFVEKLQANPSYQARTELGEWAVNGNFTITPEGNFLAYKKVNDDYTSIHDGVTKNDVGTTVVMPGGRGNVDDNRNNLCSKGLHFCSKGYLPQFGRSEGNRVVLLEIDPADVVSIPTDYNFTKGRAWQYKVIADVTDKIGLNGDGKIINKPVANGYDDWVIIDDYGNEEYDDEDTEGEDYDPWA